MIRTALASLLLVLLSSSAAGSAAAAPAPDVPDGTVVAGPIGERLDAWFSRLVPLGYSGGVVA